jgi:ElaA protein
MGRSSTGGGDASGMPDALTWTLRPYEELSVDELYELLEIRQRVFVVEQKCPYLDADGRDKDSWHLFGRSHGMELTAYLRIVAPGRRFPEPSIGRVLTHPDRRGRGHGKVLMHEGIRCCQGLFPGMPIRISAQAYLQRFYADLGFELDREGDPYEEDGIPHVEMVYPARPLR